MAKHARIERKIVHGGLGLSSTLLLPQSLENGALLPFLDCQDLVSLKQASSSAAAAVKTYMDVAHKVDFDPTDCKQVALMSFTRHLRGCDVDHDEPWLAQLIRNNQRTLEVVRNVTLSQRIGDALLTCSRLKEFTSSIENSSSLSGASFTQLIHTCRQLSIVKLSTQDVDAANALLACDQSLVELAIFGLNLKANQVSQVGRDAFQGLRYLGLEIGHEMEALDAVRHQVQGLSELVWLELLHAPREIVTTLVWDLPNLTTLDICNFSDFGTMRAPKLQHVMGNVDNLAALQCLAALPALETVFSHRMEIQDTYEPSFLPAEALDLLRKTVKWSEFNNVPGFIWPSWACRAMASHWTSLQELVLILHPSAANAVRYLFALPVLEVMGLHCEGYEGEIDHVDSPASELKSLPSEAKRLKKLMLELADATTFHGVSFPSLEPLDLRCVNDCSLDLALIVASAPKLLELNVTDCKLVHCGSLSTPFEAMHLDRLELTDLAAFDLTSLRNLLRLVKHCRSAAFGWLNGGRVTSLDVLREVVDSAVAMDLLDLSTSDVGGTVDDVQAVLSRAIASQRIRELKVRRITALSPLSLWSSSPRSQFINGFRASLFCNHGPVPENLMRIEDQLGFWA